MKVANRTVYWGVMVAGLAVLTVGLRASTSAEDEGQAPARFQRIDLSTIAAARGFKPASLDAERKVKVILKLSGASVGQRQAEALKRGKELSKAERAAIRAALKSQQNGLKGSIQALGGEVLADYQDAYNGLAVRIALKDLAALSELPGVVALHPVRVIERHNTAGVQYINGHFAWDAFTGDGVKVAIIDTGVDYYHANFGGEGDPNDFANDNSAIIEPGTFPTLKVVGGTDLVGDAYNASSDDPAEATPAPDPDPLDCNGHGSHVGGTAAGFGVLSTGNTFGGPYNSSTFSSNSFKIGPGVAPEADILAVRVFGCAGSTSEEVIVAALNFSLAQDADVVNMSIGSIFGRDDEPSVESSNTLAEAGVVVVASAGNDGASAYITSAPAVASRAISVAALDGSGATFPGAFVSLSTGKTITAQNSNDATLPSGALPVAVLRTSYPSGPVSLGCDPAEYTNFPGGGVAGKLVVTVRGVCARVARAVFGEQAGAAAVAMINTDSGFPPFEGEITGNPDTGEEFLVTIPFLGVRGVLGPALTADGDDLVAADGGTATLSATTVPNPGYQRLASFTSGGPANVDSDPKPEVTAPGVSVLSTSVGTGNQGTRLSGTSMAAPMTTGVAALVTEAHPTWTTEQIKAAIINTANASSAKILGYDPRRAGSGVVDARKAVDTVGLATTTAGKGTLAFGYEPLAAAYSETLPLTLHNTGSSAISYALSSAFVGNTLGAAISFSPSSVTVPAGGSATVQVTLQLTAVAALPAAEVSNFGALVNVRGAVVATPTSGAGIYPLRVPFVLVPRGLSNVVAGPKTPYAKGKGSTFTTTVALTNSGIHSGTADVYAWGITDPNDVAGPADEPMDIRSVGVQALPGPLLGGSANDRALVFAINGYGRWSNASVNEFDILIDLQNNGRPDFFVVGVDLGAVTAGAFDGRFASVIFDAAGNLINAWVATAPMNGSTVLLPTLASDIGLDPAVNSTKFHYAVNGFSIVPGGLVDTTATGQFRSHQPPVSTGDFIPLAPGGTATLSLTLDKGKFAGTPVLGWIVATLDDANGGSQADEVPIGPLP